MTPQPLEPDQELRALLAAAPPVPPPSPELDGRVRALLLASSVAPPRWKRLLWGEIRVPVPVLVALVALLVWALARRAPSPQPATPQFRLTPVEARGYVAVTAPKVTIVGRRGEDREARE